MSTAPSSESSPQRLATIRSQLAELEAFLDPEALAARVAELEGRMGAPGFWDDQEQAAKVSAEHSRASRRLELWTTLASDVEDLEAMTELADEDPSLIRSKANLIPRTIDPLRVVDVVGLDRQADSGTHVASTREVGTVRVTGTRSKGRDNKRVRIALAE